MLNDLEIDSIQALLTNELQLAILRKVFNDAVEINRPEVTKTDNNVVLGEKYRAYEFSKGVLEAGFKSLLLYKITPKDKILNRAK